jgi:NTP pyrophosphatase (non-canonical NTP hydrolase)
MDIITYRIGTRETALMMNTLAPPLVAISYATLGLADELSEVLQAAELYNNDKQLFDEISDFNWYLFRCFDLLDITPIMPEPHTAIVDIGRKLAIEVGKVAGRVKKMIRDGVDLQYEGPQRKIVADALQETLMLINHFCYLHGFKLEDVWQHNHDKLLSRKERGVLQGDGGNR